MPIRPRSGRSRVVRQRKSCSSSSALGCLKLNTWQPCGLTPDITCCDGAVLAGRVHGLKNQQHGIAVRRIQQLLLRAERLDVLAQQVLVVLAGPVCRGHPGRPFLEIDLIAFAYPKLAGIDVHDISEVSYPKIA